MVGGGGRRGNHAPLKTWPRPFLICSVLQLAGGQFEVPERGKDVPCQCAW